ncbi:MAG: hypothetical protein HC780_29250 [Leptolyngbyaceae cyanobacterium CSU_1_3]|nr:hypothetical protein [Leptolyngbyaceae cyanobacterium CSU_1_3]
MARLADINRRAPIVAQNTSFCALSPGGRHLAFFRSFNPQTSFLDTATHTIVEIPISPELSTSKMLWLRDELYFYYTTWEVRQTPDREYNAPTNGWIVDVSARTIQDIKALPPDIQSLTLTQAESASEAIYNI